MDRKDELLALCKNREKEASQLVDEIIFIEKQLEQIRLLPFIKVNPKNSMQQKTLPAGKLYKEFLQQYNNCLKLFAHMTGQNIEDEESPLRKWAKARSEKLNAD